jgi:hypothetical protein
LFSNSAFSLSDICRLSEAAIGNFITTLQLTWDSVSSFAMEEITSLTDEITKLKGGVTFVPSVFNNLMKETENKEGRDRQDSGIDQELIDLTKETNNSNNNSTLSFNRNSRNNKQQQRKKIQREDMWLSVQRYKVSVRDSQEALCVLISESMDLELQSQILTNRVHNTFTYIMESYFSEETSLSNDIDTIFNKVSKSINSSVEIIGIPHPVLQSPFAKLNPAFFSTSTAATLEETEENHNQEEERENEGDPVAVLSRQGSGLTKEYEDFINSVGIYSFTTLFKEPLPINPGVIKSGYLLTIRPSDFAPSSSRSASPSLPDTSLTASSAGETGIASGLPPPANPIWKTAYLVATSDGYLHIIFGKKSDMPDRSFYMKSSFLNEFVPSLTNEELREKVFELFIMNSSVQHNQRGQIRHASARIIEGFYIQTTSKEEKEEWIHILRNLTSLPIHLDETVEKEANHSMLESLPILKGETAKIDLEMKNYEIFQQNNPVNTSRSFSHSIDEKDKDHTKDCIIPSSESGSPQRIDETIKVDFDEGAYSTPVSQSQQQRGMRKKKSQKENKQNKQDQHQVIHEELNQYFTKNTLPIDEEDSDSDIISPVFKMLGPSPFSPSKSIHSTSSTSLSPLAPSSLNASRSFTLNNSPLKDSGSSSDDSHENFFYISRSDDEYGGRTTSEMMKRKKSQLVLDQIEEEEESEHHTNGEAGEEVQKEETEVTELDTAFPTDKNGSHDEETVVVVDNKIETEEIILTSETLDATSVDHQEKHEDDEFFKTITNHNLKYETDSEDEDSGSKKLEKEKSDSQQSSPTRKNRLPPSSGKKDEKQASRSAYGFGYPHNNSTESWIKHNNSQDKSTIRRPPSVPSMLPSSSTAVESHLSKMSSSSSSNSQFVGIIPVQTNIKPKQLIPLTDSSVPLARRHSQMIKQCKNFVCFG